MTRVKHSIDDLAGRLSMHTEIFCPMLMDEARSASPLTLKQKN